MKQIYILAQAATENISARPSHEQIKIYEALGELLPIPRERMEARRVAFALSEANKMQLEFAINLGSGKGTK